MTATPELREDTDPAVPTDVELDAEMSMLGAMMLGPSVAIPDVLPVLSPAHLYRPAHQTIMEAILRLDAHQAPVDPVSVTDELERQGQLRRVGGPPYVHTLITRVPTATNAGYYAEIVREAANRRAAMRLATRIAQLAGQRDNGSLTGLIQEEMAGYQSAVSSTSAELAPVGTELDAWIASKLDPSPPPGLTTGLLDLDALTRLKPGTLTVVAARPGVGKTVMGLKLARHVAMDHDLPVLVFSLEMSRAELLDRLVAGAARVDYGRIETKSLMSDDWERINRKLDAIRAAPLYVEDNPDRSIDDISAIARDYQQRLDGRLALLVVDYAQLIRPRAHRRETNREREVAEISRGLLLLGKQLQVPVVLLAQLNRGPETRGDRLPQASDLRESGALEQDAHQVWLLYRPEYGVPREKIEANPEDYHVGEMQLILAKNRSGLTGAPWFAWRGAWQDVTDMRR